MAEQEPTMVDRALMKSLEPTGPQDQNLAGGALAVAAFGSAYGAGVLIHSVTFSSRGQYAAGNEKIAALNGRVDSLHTTEQLIGERALGPASHTIKTKIDTIQHSIAVEEKHMPAYDSTLDSAVTFGGGIAIGAAVFICGSWAIGRRAKKARARLSASSTPNQ
jgi:F0F1-type ATP synthase membrane subunit c/vacuolar-type H+-ATPase subunit K